MMHRLPIIAGILALTLSDAALAQSTATPVVTGYLTSSGCPAGQTTCFVQFGSSGGGGTVTCTNCELESGGNADQQTQDQNALVNAIPNSIPAGANTIGSVFPAPSASTGTVSAATITTSSTQFLAAASSRTLLAIDNESTTATIACRFGATAALNTAGSFTIPAGATRTWNSYPVPIEAVNCIASASAPATIESF